MSRKDEDRILHGLHYYRESIDEEFAVTGEQVLWLAAHSYADGSNWHKDGELQSFDCDSLPSAILGKLFMSKFELPLRYLHYRRLIKLSQSDIAETTVAVTFAGADRAMRLHTRMGRMEVWYEEHKEGFLGIVTTIAVSLITTLITVAVLERLHESPAAPARSIFQSDSRPQP